MMTAKQKKKEREYPNLPSVSTLMNPLLKALRERGGKGEKDEVKTAVASEVLDQHFQTSAAPSVMNEIQLRLDRALELLNNAGLVCKRGIHSLKLTSKALVVPASAVEKLAAEHGREAASMDIVVESEKTLPLPDEIALDILKFLSAEKQLTALEMDELVLRMYAYDHGILESEELEQITRRVLTARRIIEAKQLIAQDNDGMFKLTERGRSVRPQQVQRLARLSIGTYLRHQLLKMRLLVEEQVQIETRKHVFAEVRAFILGIGRYFARRRRHEPRVQLVREKQATYSD